MQIKEKTVKEFEFTSTAHPHHSVVVRAETPEKAAKKAIAELTAFIAEIREHHKGQQNKPTPQQA